MIEGVPLPETDAWFLDASAWYKLKRSSSPLYHDPERGTWHVFLYSDVEHVLSQFGTFSSQYGYMEQVEHDEEIDPAKVTIMGSLIAKDPPIHTKLRNIVSKAFSPQSITSLEPRVREIADGLLSEALTSKEDTVDFISAFAEPFPVTVIAELLGIPSKDRTKFKKWSDVEIGSSDVDSQGQDSSHAELIGYLSAIIEERKKDPRNDLISSIVTSEIDGQKLTRQEALSFCILLLIAGNETTTNLLGSAMRLFAKYDTLEELHAKPEMIPGAIEEVLRFASPVRAMFRTTAKETEIQGKKIPSGESVLAWIGSANRDENKFAQADKFDITRASNPHIAFGRGVHLCLGAPLARLESKVALQLITEKYSGVKLKVPDDQLPPVKNIVVGGVKHLPIQLVAA